MEGTHARAAPSSSALSSAAALQQGKTYQPPNSYVDGQGGYQAGADAAGAGGVAGAGGEAQYNNYAGEAEWSTRKSLDVARALQNLPSQPAYTLCPKCVRPMDRCYSSTLLS